MKKESPQQLLNALQSQMEAAVCCLDDELNFVFVTKGYASLYGEEIDFFVGQNFKKLFPVKLLHEIVLGVKQTGKPFLLEAQPFQEKIGPRNQSLWNWSISYHKENDKGCLLIELEDVSHQIRLKETEISQQNRYKDLFDRSLAGLYQRTVTGKILQCNNTFAKLIGAHSTNEVIEKNIQDFIKIKKKELLAIWSQLIDGEMPVRETTFFLPNGDRRVVLEQAKLIENEDADDLIEGSLIDVTEMAVAREKIEKNKEEIANLQTQMLAAQMNPHFIFNAVNSISSFILRDDLTKALEYTTDFAELMRDVLRNSTKTNIKLKKEIEFLKKYLDLERRRLNESFSYKITVPKDLDIKKLAVPPMILQPFLENAVIHAVSKVNEGKIEVKLNVTENGYLECTVTDNGPGLESSSAGNKRSMGTEITSNRLKLLSEKSNGESVSLKNIKDNTGKIQGVEALVKVPLL